MQWWSVAMTEPSVLRLRERMVRARRPGGIVQPPAFDAERFEVYADLPGLAPAAVQGSGPPRSPGACSRT